MDSQMDRGLDGQIVRLIMSWIEGQMDRGLDGQRVRWIDCQSDNEKD